MMKYVLDDYGENFLKVSNDSNKNIMAVKITLLGELILK